MKKICLITFSNNTDHQNVIYSMFEALQEKTDVFTIGILNPKSQIAPKTKRNYYFDCPSRPGIECKTFRINIVAKIAKIIKENNINYIYFESVHVWNILLMWMCPQCIRVEAVHDVIPHDLSKTVVMCTMLACKIADHVVLRNEKYKKQLSDVYKIPESKITCFAPWRDFPVEDQTTYSGTFLYFGRIRKYKGLEILERIIQKSQDVHYQIVGEPDKESNEIVNKLSIYSNVDMIAREVTDEEMINLFHSADWIVLPYTTATQSGVIVDSYRLSRPVIAFNVGAINEQINDGVTGFLIERNNEDAFREAVKKAASMSLEETEQFSHYAYTYGYTKYAAAAVSDKFVKMLYSMRK